MWDDSTPAIGGSPLMLAGKARSLPLNGAPEWYFTQVGSGLT